MKYTLRIFISLKQVLKLILKPDGSLNNILLSKISSIAVLFACCTMSKAANCTVEPTLSFIAEWFDCHPQVTKKYVLKYYPSTNEVEMKDIGTRSKFLKRTKIPDSEKVAKIDFYIGSNIILFSRDLKLVEYGDSETRSCLEGLSETSVAVITPIGITHIGKIVHAIEESGLTLVNLKSLRVEDELITDMTSILGIEPHDLKKSREQTGNLNNTMDYCIAIECRGENCIECLLSTSSNLEKSLQKECSLYEEDTNDSRTDHHSTFFIVASPNSEHAKIYKDLFITCKHPPTALYDNEHFESRRTCVIIKPHAIKARTAGSILSDILIRKYDISAMQIFHLDRIKAREFYEVYQTAVKEFHPMVDELCSGPALVLEVQSPVDEFRNVAGPFDVDMAKTLHPGTIRAKYGKDRVQNAIHCTDLPEESYYELSYFFDILYN